ncbi:MAG: hypothetical protein KJ051_03415 [Thermoleophilia bacterium]|nr:hypothetical protein [Thermoleophilia bacterium]
MKLRRAGPFAEVVDRQLALFGREASGLLGETEAALRAYDGAAAGEAEERYGEYVDLLDFARDELEAIRDAYARTLAPEAVERYRAVFAERARRRFPAIAAELE